MESIRVLGACEHNLKRIDIEVPRDAITVVTGVSGSGKSSLAFDTILAEAQRRFFYTLSNYTRQFLDMGSRPKVESVEGLSPAISLAQNETKPSRRATVGSLAEVNELLGVLYANCGDQHCPTHRLPTGALELDALADRVLQSFDEQTVAVCAPIAHAKKGNFRTRLAKFAVEGFIKAIIDGEVMELDPVPTLAKEEKHTIQLVVDFVTVRSKNRERLLRSLSKALEVGGEVAELVPCNKRGQPLGEKPYRVSTAAGCPECGFAWPRLDSRYFNANSLGKCEECAGFGLLGEDQFEEGVTQWDASLEAVELLCQECKGTGVREDISAITISGLSVQDLLTQDCASVSTVVVGWQKQLASSPVAARVLADVAAKLRQIEAIGLGYLALARRVLTLSPGESQRLKLAGILSESLSGVLYVLDEPSQGLHPDEIETLCQTLAKLRDAGNTILLVDHDEMIMRSADWIIDLGPGGGREGGQLLAKFAPAAAKEFASLSLTARYLSGQAERQGAEKATLDKRGEIAIVRPRLNNLKADRVVFQKSALNVVTGVSGSGKSSLAIGTLFENLVSLFEVGSDYNFRCCDSIAGLESIERAFLVDRSPMGRSTVSMPATYLDVFKDIRDLYAKTSDAQISGLTARDFSLQVEGGRCPECKGRGQVLLSMRFLADARVTCPVCEGDRYRPHVLDIKYQGVNISEVLGMTLAEVAERFAHHKKISSRLEPALGLGLGYLSLGQPTVSLSGGESQRLKLVPFFAKKYGVETLVVVDEPTTGLHFSDVDRLLDRLRRLANDGVTVILIEHNLDIARQADWLVDLGPGSATRGGQVLYQGNPSGLKSCKESITAKYWTS